MFSAMKNQEKINMINDLLEKNPDLIPKLQEFKDEDPMSFNSSIVNFDTNAVRLDLLEKLAEGKKLTWYDWM
jgi:hypothetical protein